MVPVAICLVTAVIFALWFTPLGSRVGVWGGKR